MCKLYLLCLLLTICSSLGGYFLKKSTEMSGDFFMIISNINFYIGMMFYTFGVGFNIIALRYLPYTIVMPITSIAYIWTILISYFFLNEIIKIKKVIGTFLIIVGAICLVIFKQ